MLALDLPTDTPANAEEIAKIVAAGRPLEVVGGGTKRGIGQVTGAQRVLSLARLDKVVDYQPEELVLTAQPGVKLATLEKLVAAEGQMLPFEPPRLTRLLGAKGQPTLGGVLAAGLSGPRRLRAGAARDHVLGIAAVTGRGEIVKAGGKVVKNVTGYDLSKLMAGSWGTLAVLTEVTLKVLPAPKTETTLLLFGLPDERASLAMQRAMNAPVEVSGAAHLPPAAAARAPLKADMAVTALRLEGFEASVAARADALAGALRDFGRVERLDPDHSRPFWSQVREVEAFWKDRRPLWRVSLPPVAGWRFLEGLEGDVLYDWAGGLVWLATEAPALSVRAQARRLGGHATLYRGEGAAFEPLPGALAALSARVKAAFDPNGVLNPGRFVEG
jgi:glycolate oxidase FAD binding subunit